MSCGMEWMGRRRSVVRRWTALLLTLSMLWTGPLWMSATPPALAETAPVAAASLLHSGTAPVALVDGYQIHQNTTLNQAAPGVLSNDTDAESDPLTAVLVTAPTHGAVTLRADGSFVYTPTTGFLGHDHFTYQANDGTLSSNAATVRINVVRSGCLPPYAGLVDWWAADGDTADAAGYNPGYLENGASYASGKVGQAFNFSGAGQRMRVVNTPTLILRNNLTVMAWFKVNLLGVGGHAKLFTKRTGIFGPFEVDVYNNGTDLTVSPMGSTTGTSWNVNLTTNPTATTGTWHHAAFVMNGDNLFSFYLDGQLKGTKQLSAPLMDHPIGDLILGIDNGGSFPLYGAMDEVMIFNRALTAGEIDALYQADSAGVCVPLNIASREAADFYGTNYNTRLSIPAAGVLSNDIDLESDPLTAMLVTSSTYGAVALRADGSFAYTPTAGFEGVDRFTYKANDGWSDSGVTTVTIGMSRRGCVSQGPGLVGWWAGEADTADYAGGNPGYLVNGPSYASGKVGEAFNFNGDGQSMSVVAAPTLSMRNNLTVMSWFKVDQLAAAAYAEIFIKPLGSYAPFDVYAYHNEGFIKVYLDGSTTGTSLDMRLTSSSTITVGSWHHVAFAMDGNNLVSFYLDGQLQGTRQLSAPLMDHAIAALKVGNDNSGYGSLHGMVDELMIFNRALTAGEIDAVYRADSAGICFRPNAAPVAVADRYQTGLNTTLNQLVPGVLSNDSDADGDLLTVTLVTTPTHGAVMLRADGSFVYTPTTGYEGPDGFTYKANDGGLDSNVVTATINVMQPVCVMPYSGLIGWWAGEGTTADFAGNNPGYLENGAAYTSGKVGRAFNFSGGGQRMRVVPTPTLALRNNLTVMAWFKVNALSVGGHARIFTKRTGIFGPFEVDVYNNGTRLAVSPLGSTTGTSWDVGQMISPTVATGTWHHTAFVMDGNNLFSFYLDGQLQGTQQMTNSLMDSTISDFMLGSDIDGSYPLNGVVDEAMIFNRALTAEEIQTFYAVDSGGFCGPLIGLSIGNSIPVYPAVATSFTATVLAGIPMTYAWNFGDGQTALGSPISHTYSAPGTYAVVVTATGDLNVLTQTTAVVVQPLFVNNVTLSAQPMTLLANGVATSLLTITATDQLGQGAGLTGVTGTLTWTLGSEPAPVVTLDAQGTARVIYTAGVVTGTEWVTATFVGNGITRTAGISLQLQDAPMQGKLTSVMRGDRITYTFVVTNMGTTVAQTNLVISGSVPAYTELVWTSAAVSSTAGGDYGQGYVESASLGSLAPGASAQLVWSVRTLTMFDDIVTRAHGRSDTAVLRLRTTSRIYRMLIPFVYKRYLEP